MKRREFKKQLQFITSEVFAECVAISAYSKDHKNEAQDLMVQVLLIHDDFTSRVTHVEPGIKPKAYFKALREDLATKIMNIVESMQSLA